MVTFVMLSHETRVASRAASLASLAQAGVEPELVISTYTGPTPDAEHRRAAFTAVTYAHSRSEALVFLEDDIEARPDLLQRHVDMAAAADVITVFCAVNERHYPDGVLEQAELPVSLAPIPNYDADRGFHGSMAVFVPQRVVEYGVAHPEQFQQPDGSPLERPVIEPDHKRGKVTGFDFWLKSVARRFGGMLVALPNSVNHVSRHGTWPSLTFHVPVAGT